MAIDSKVKKYFTLSILFVFPIIIYLILSSGVNHFVKLPILNKNVKSLESIGLDTETSFENNVSILGFWGSVIDNRSIGGYNLNQNIYNRFYQYDGFQFVIVVSKGMEKQITEFKYKISNELGTDTSKWKFIFAEEFQIKELFISLNTPFTLDENYSTPYVFIIDKKGYLRGRNEKEEILYGFNTNSIAMLDDKMVDDVKIVLAEYRLALKKNSTIINEK